MKWVVTLWLLAGGATARIIPSVVTQYKPVSMWIQYRDEQVVEDRVILVLQGMTIQQHGRIRTGPSEVCEIEVSCNPAIKTDALGERLKHTPGVLSVTINYNKTGDVIMTR